ncbi:MAG TPA: glycosyltransferase [Polyangiaceae bacterium]
MSAKKTLIFIPTYNERNNVGPMCEQLFALGLDADIVFMDDSSPDGTGAILDEIARKHERLSVMHRPAKSGIGSAHVAGIAYAYDNGYQRLVTLDCDFTHSPDAIPTFLARAEEADAVVGSRYLLENSLPDWTLFRRALTTLGHALTTNVLGIEQDATGAFRVYNLETIPRALFDLVQSRGYAFFFESLFILHTNGFRIAEVPLALPARTYGSSKMSGIEVARSVKTLGSLWFTNVTKPSRFRLAGVPEIDSELVDVQNWNEYWDKKERATTATYDAIATVYRNAVIKRRLEKTIEREFSKGSCLLHAGCGSGQVDVNLHEHANIVAVDISESALRTYLRENPHAKVRHASIFSLPFEERSFDGAYNLGVVEHFTHEELGRAFGEIRRVLKPGAKVVVFWPHAQATSVKVLGLAHWVLNDVLDKNVQLHPPEPSLVHSRSEASKLLASGGLELVSYDFGPKDLFVQAVVVAKRPD